MKICVVSGSPSGKYSITLQTIFYIKEQFPGHSWSYLNPGQRIRAYARDFTPAKNALEEAELILFCYPVYTFLVPSPLHRFIELMKEKQAAKELDLRGKFCAQVLTSKHFYDVTAMRFVRENCDDMGLAYLSALSADMEDLTLERGKRDAVRFFAHLLWQAENRVVAPKIAQTSQNIPVYQRQFPDRGMNVPAKGMDFSPSGSHEDKDASVGGSADRKTAEKAEGEADTAESPASKKQIVILTDSGTSAAADTNEGLFAMIADFRAVIRADVRVIDLADVPMAGGCLGCFACAADGHCVYKDGFDEFLRQKIQTADATVYAFSIRDHSMGSRFKMYDDRQFCNGHRTVTMGQPVGYLIEGDLSAEPNLAMLIEARADVGGNYLAGAATDAQGIVNLAKNLNYAIDTGFTKPYTFYGVGGMKIFRDLIFQMRGMMRADHRFYKQHGFYDFPQKRKKEILLMYLVGFMNNNPKVRKKVGNRMSEGMVAPYKKVLKESHEEEFS